LSKAGTDPVAISTFTRNGFINDTLSG